MEALRVENLSKNFGGVKASREISFAVNVGEKLAIIGPNGAGKTTLFNQLNGQLSPSSGRMFLFGKEITKMPTYQRAQFGLSRSFQVTNLFPNLTVFENCMLALHGTRLSRYQMYRSFLSYDQLCIRAQQLLDTADLLNNKDSLPHELSYGDQRRLEIAISLAAKPRLLLLDEPSAGLTADESAAVVEIITNLGIEITVLIISHDMDLVYGVAQRILVLHYGEIIADGTPEKIKAEPKVRQMYMGIKEST